MSGQCPKCKQVHPTIKVSRLELDPFCIEVHAGDWSISALTPESLAISIGTMMHETACRGRQLAATIEWAEQMRRALKKLQALVQHETDLPRSAQNGVTDETGTIDEGVVRAGEVLEEVRLALSEPKGEMP